ncbi:MAG: tRNA pseudouridine(55) synthase TruB [Oscillospiraceae bacterium]|nr:tRNA pseudouridine(55) synthase TruB [Oscillospiraceae bacterium]
MNSNLNGILCVDKPAGFTSFDVIAKLRGILKMKRLGHAGTLDPMAMGVLPVFVGYATKACGILPNEDKIYIAEFQLGKISDTQDSTGKILETHDFTGISKQDILDSVPTGEIMQIPPMYSAVSVNGKRLYELAREGKEIERQARPVSIKLVYCTGINPETGKGTLEIHCGKGTYVRTLIHDMGKTLGCGAVMTNLRRSYASGFDLDSCYSLEQIQEFADKNNISKIIIPIEKAFSSLPVVNLNVKQTKLYRNGVKLDLSQFAINFKSQQYAVYGTDGFLGTALPDLEQNCLRIERNLCEPLHRNEV